MWVVDWNKDKFTPINVGWGFWPNEHTSVDL